MKKKTRIKNTIPVLQSRTDMENAFGTLTEAQANLNAITGEMDAELTKVRAKYEERIAPLNQTIKLQSTLLEQWAEANTDAFGKKKSISTLHGILGWRKTPHAVKTLSRLSFDKVIERLKKLGGNFTDYIRYKPTLDKDAIIACRKELTEDDLKKMGVKIVQKDDFYITPNITEETASKAA